MKIFDIHIHFPRNWENPEEDPAPMVDRLAEIATQVGITKGCMLTGGRFGPTYERGMEILQNYKELFIPVAVVDPEEIDGEGVQRLYDMGYRGLKLIGVQRPYDEPDYMPTYAKAQDLNMPILFHMGVIGGGLDYSITHPRREAAAAQAYQRMMAMQDRMPPRNVSATRMSPLHLDTIANRLPKLKIIGAHVGNQGNYDYAASVARWRHNVYFDMSGGETIERHLVERKLLAANSQGEFGVEKLIFGSDCGMDEIHEHIKRFEIMYEQIGLTEDEIERLWWRNGAEIYGLETPTFAGE
ncbi:MAG TPA: amidohydrolase family protein [Tepidiformaceae bacterium]|nr:amidohydrolase family protein [Tepidiformaceae bacterium]